VEVNIPCRQASTAVNDEWSVNFDFDFLYWGERCKVRFEFLRGLAGLS